MDSLIGLEWQAMSQADQDTVWRAYDYGAERNFRELGGIYAHESRGDMSARKKEYNGDWSVGPGQNLVRYAAIRTFGEDYTPAQYLQTDRRLQKDLDYSLAQSMEQIKLGLKKFWSRWKQVKYYNGQNKKTEDYPAWVMAWTRFLDNKRLRRK